MTQPAPGRNVVGRFFFLLTIAVCLLLFASTESFAQLALIAPSQASITHDMTSADQLCSDTVWEAGNSSSLLGVTVVLTASPFVHETLATSTADVRLTLSIESQTPGAGWLPIVQTAATDVGAGSNVAIVAASSVIQGDADIRLETLFIGEDPSSLVAGSYNSTVTGTITAN